MVRKKKTARCSSSTGTLNIVYNHKLMYLDPKDADTDNDYISDDRNDNFDGVNRNHAFNNDFDLDMHEPGD